LIGGDPALVYRIIVAHRSPACDTAFCPMRAGDLAEAASIPQEGNADGLPECDGAGSRGIDVRAYAARRRRQ